MLTPMVVEFLWSSALRPKFRKRRSVYGNIFEPMTSRNWATAVITPHKGDDKIREFAVPTSLDFRFGTSPTTQTKKDP